MGQVVAEENGEYSLVQSGLDPLNLKKVKVLMLNQKRIQNINDAGRTDQFMNAEELKDLVAYFVSAGDKKHKIFAPLRNSN